MIISDSLHEAFKSNIRQIHARIKLNFSDVTLDPSATATSETGQDYTYQVVLGNTVTPVKWALMDGLATMDGTWCMTPNDVTDVVNQVGYWGDTLVNPDLSCDDTIVITSNKRTISSFQIYSDNSRYEYFIDAEIRFYSDSILIGTETITGNSDIFKELTFTTPYQAVDKIEFHVTKYSTPNTVVKVVALLTSLVKTIDATDIISFDTTEESEISNSNTVPTGNISYSNCNLSIINRNRQYDINNHDSPLFGAIKPNSKIDIELGAKTSQGIEYFKFFSGWTGAFNAPENSQEVTTTAFDRVQRLKLSTMSASPVMLNRTASYIAKYIINDSGVADQYIDIDDFLDTDTYLIPVYYIGGGTHLDELKRLSEAISSSVYSVSDIIHVDSIEKISYNSAIQETYSRSDYTDKTNDALYDTIINTVNLTYYPLGLQDEKEEYKGKNNIIAGESIIELTLKDDSCVNHVLTSSYEENEVTIDGLPPNITITNQENYSDRVILTILNTNLTIFNDIEFIVNAQYYDQSQKRVMGVSDSASIAKYGETVFNYKQNDLIQTSVLANNICDRLVKSYKDPARDCTVQLTNAGNPATSLQEKIEIQDRYSKVNYNLISKQVTYDGGLSMLLKMRKSAIIDSDINGYGVSMYGVGFYG